MTAQRQPQQGRAAAQPARPRHSERGPRGQNLRSMPGAHGITMHPRPDERHIRRHDAHDLRRRSTCAERRPHAEFNIEGNPSGTPRAGRAPCGRTSARWCRTRRSADVGPRLGPRRARRAPAQTSSAELHGDGVRVSLFMDPDLAQIERVPAHRRRPRRALYRAVCARVRHGATPRPTATAPMRLPRAARRAGRPRRQRRPRSQPARTSALLQRRPGVLEVSIGHALIADALELGWPPPCAPICGARQCRQGS